MCLLAFLAFVYLWGLARGFERSCGAGRACATSGLGNQFQSRCRANLWLRLLGRLELDSGGVVGQLQKVAQPRPAAHRCWRDGAHVRTGLVVREMCLLAFLAFVYLWGLARSFERSCGAGRACATFVLGNQFHSRCRANPWLRLLDQLGLDSGGGSAPFLQVHLGCGCGVRRSPPASLCLGSSLSNFSKEK